LDPKTLNKIKGLGLKARLIIEGMVTGSHRSPYHGFSVEFAEHREYVAGDDIRHVDWKVFGKSDRFYIKQYEEETNLNCTIVLDTSESMEYASGEVSKLEYGRYIAASLAYLVLQQQDAVGLALFDESLNKVIPPSTHGSHLKILLNEMESCRGKGKKTAIGTVLHNLAERVTKRGMIVLISDLFDDPDGLLSGLRHLRHRKHDVIVFQVVDHSELTFPFERLTRFVGLEALPTVLANPGALRKSYLEEFERFTSRVKKACQANRVDYELIHTDQKLDVALSRYLATRAGSGRALS
jgi:uncharacterized protein (DUF58 family)